MEIFIESLTTEWHNLVRLTPRILTALLLFVVFLSIGRLIGRAVWHLVAKGNLKPTHRNFFRSLTAWLFAIFGLIMGLNVLGLKSLAASLVAGGGITAVVLGFAFREIGENFLAGFFLAFSRPFEVGNLIQSGEFQGIVKSIELRSTHVRTADGRDIFIPSSQIFKDALVNFTKDGLRRLSFTVGIDYGDDSARAREILLETIAGIEGVLPDPKPATNMSALGANFVVLEVAFWIDTFQKGADLFRAQNNVMEQCRRALSENGFTFSSNVTTIVALAGYQPIDVRLEKSAV